MPPVRVLKIAINGLSGRMGQEIAALLKTDSRFELLAFDLRKKTLLEEQPAVVIDFSNPEGATVAARWCVRNLIPFVTGVTGLDADQTKVLRDAATKVPVLSSPNMSVGLNSMAKAVATFSKVFAHGEVVIEDIHHRHKKDSPSGTAKLLHQTVKNTASANVTILEPVSIRAGEVFGIHKVYFFMEGELVCFEHQAQGRSVFARGALEVGHWLTFQKPGFYEMKDYLEDTSR